MVSKQSATNTILHEMENHGIIHKGQRFAINDEPEMASQLQAI